MLDTALVIVECGWKGLPGKTTSVELFSASHKSFNLFSILLLALFFFKRLTKTITFHLNGLFH